MTRIVFETHATSLDNEAGLASGWFDADLSPVGERQAQELGARHAAPLPDVVFTSDARRTRRTAAIAFGNRVATVSDRRLRECDYGELTRASTTRIDAIRLSCVDTPFPGGESYLDVVRRVGEWLDEVLREHDGKTLLVVGHRATWYALEHLLAGKALAEVIGAEWQWQPGWRYDAPGSIA